MDIPEYFTYDGIHCGFTSIADTASCFNWSASVSLNNGSIVTLYGLQGGDGEECENLAPLIGKRTLPVVKSNLQKCIRRKDVDRAVRSAYAILSLNPNELLRRLPIIMIEDCLPYPYALIRIVWWMMAVSKGYKLSRVECNILMGMVSTLCECEQFECFNNTHCSVPDSVIDVTETEHKYKAFHWALEIRKMYGGMKCDISMLTYHQHLWHERFKQESKWWAMLQDRNDYEIDIGNLSFSVEDILVASVDFHPYRFIPSKMGDKFPQLTTGSITQAIWLCRSRINKRSPINPLTYRQEDVDSRRIYNIIESELDGFCLWLLTKIDISR